MKAWWLLSLLPLAAFSASAQSSAEALDLSLPAAPITYASDPPGTYYGDTNSRPIELVRPTAAHCGTDDGKVDVSGEVRTGIGYTKGVGSSRWNGASINLCKTTYNDDGKPRTFNMDIHVDKFDGHMPGGGPYRGYPGWR
jgi:hypothetical protein